MRISDWSSDVCSSDLIDLDICVGCHACAVNCKEWNSGGHSAPLTDWNAYSGTEAGDGGDDAGAWGVWFNRVHTFEAGEGAEGRTVHFPRSCLHCETPARSEEHTSELQSLMRISYA